jgi:excisionase family DNA binding protein
VTAREHRLRALMADLGEIAEDPVLRAELAAHGWLLERTAPDYVNVKEYARRHAISVPTVRRAYEQGRLPVERIGRSVRIRSDAKIAPPREATRNRRVARRLGVVDGGRP